VCQSTHCVDSVCCDSLCDGQCEACNLAIKGQCAALSSGQPVGNRIPCDNSGSVCGAKCMGARSCTYPDSSARCADKTGCIDAATSIQGLGCDGAGSCSVPLPQVCVSPYVCNMNTDGQCGNAVYTQLDVSDSFTCAVVSDGTLRCWGDNSYGQLGLSGNQIHTVPFVVPNVSNARAVATGWLFACALLRDGQVNCWGYNCNGGLGCPFDPSAPNGQKCTPLNSGSGALQIDAGTENTCTRMADGTVKCWGRNDRGQVGDGTGGIIASCGDTNINRFAPTGVYGIQAVVDIGVGPWHSCAALSNGRLKCWGDNGAGQLGTGDGVSHWVPAQVVGIDGASASSYAVSVAVSAGSTCSIMRDGRIQCFGLNDSGQLGNGVLTNSPIPVRTQPPLLASAVAIGNAATCALASTNSVQCWGSGNFGQLGNGSFVGSMSPVTAAIPASVALASIFSKSNYFCALDAAGKILCWGDNTYGQLGNGTTISSSVPVEVASP